jgi:hypothetical protein
MAPRLFQARLGVGFGGSLLFIVRAGRDVVELGVGGGIVCRLLVWLDWGRNCIMAYIVVHGRVPKHVIFFFLSCALWS